MLVPEALLVYLEAAGARSAVPRRQFDRAHESAVAHVDDAVVVGEAVQDVLKQRLECRGLLEGALAITVPGDMAGLTRRAEELGARIDPV